jgi:hypothetical protein
MVRDYYDEIARILSRAGWTAIPSPLAGEGVIAKQ